MHRSHIEVVWWALERKFWVLKKTDVSTKWLRRFKPPFTLCYKSLVILDVCARTVDSGRKILRKRRFQNVFPPSLKRKTRFQFLRFEEQFRKAPSSWWISADGSLTVATKLRSVSKFSRVVWTRPLFLPGDKTRTCLVAVYWARFLSVPCQFVIAPLPPVAPCVTSLSSLLCWTGGRRFPVRRSVTAVRCRSERKMSRLTW